MGNQFKKPFSNPEEQRPQAPPPAAIPEQVTLRQPVVPLPPPPMPLPTDITQTPNSPSTMKQALVPYKQSSHLVSGTYLSRPTWSPDGKQIAYLVEGNEELDLWVIHVIHNTQTGVYSTQSSSVQVTSGGIDGDSRFVWAN